MNEESQVRGCYNITFIYTNQKTVGAQSAVQTKRPASAGTLGDRGRGGDGPFCFTSTEVRWLIRDGDWE